MCKYDFCSQYLNDELRNALLRKELKQLCRIEELHLDREFSNYDLLYPEEKASGKTEKCPTKLP